VNNLTAAWDALAQDLPPSDDRTSLRQAFKIGASAIYARAFVRGVDVVISTDEVEIVRLTVGLMRMVHPEWDGAIDAAAPHRDCVIAGALAVQTLLRCGEPLYKLEHEIERI
jgi:hypothetical protein